MRYFSEPEIFICFLDKEVHLLVSQVSGDTNSAESDNVGNFW